MATDVREAALLELIHDSNAIPDTVQIVREKRQGDHAVVAATFRRGSSGRLVRGFVGLRWFNERTARRIRVTDPGGRMQEDTIDSSVAILIWEGDFQVQRATAELLDDRGQVIRSGPMRPYR